MAVLPNSYPVSAANLMFRFAERALTVSFDPYSLETASL